MSRLACFYEPSGKKMFLSYIPVFPTDMYILRTENQNVGKWYGFYLFVLLKLLWRLKSFSTYFTCTIFGFVVFLLVRLQLTGVSKSPITDITSVRPPLHVYRHVSLRMTCLVDKTNHHPAVMRLHDLVLRVGVGRRLDPYFGNLIGSKHMDLWIIFISL